MAGSRFEGRTAIVTGGADGIGAEIVRAIAEEGGHAVVADIQEAKGRAVAEAASAAGPGRAAFIHCDVGEDESVDALFRETTARFGTVDVVVNNAGVAIGGTITEMSSNDWARALNIDLSSVYRTCRRALALMTAHGGAIVNIASTQAHVGFAGWSAYAAAKGGIIAMTQQLAVEFAPVGIRVNCVSPGTILTPLNEELLAKSPNREETMREWIGWHPIGRIGTPREVAAAVVFLASDDASFITGVDLRVDGGQVLRP